MLDQSKLGTGKLVTVEELAKMWNKSEKTIYRWLSDLGIKPEVPANNQAGVAAKYNLDKTNAQFHGLIEQQQQMRTRNQLEKRVEALPSETKELVVFKELDALRGRDDDWAIEQQVGIATQMFQDLLQRQSRMRDKIQVMQEDLEEAYARLELANGEIIELKGTLDDIQNRWTVAEFNHNVCHDKLSREQCVELGRMMKIFSEVMGEHISKVHMKKGKKFGSVNSYAFKIIEYFKDAYEKGKIFQPDAEADEEAEEFIL